jgi:hypothetical protein
MRFFYSLLALALGSSYLAANEGTCATISTSEDVVAYVIPCFYSTTLDQNIFIKAVATVALNNGAEGTALIHWLSTNNTWHTFAQLTTLHDSAETAIQKLCQADAATAQCLKPFKSSLITTIKKLQLANTTGTFNETGLRELIAQAHTQGAYAALYFTPELSPERLPMASIAQADAFLSAHHYFSLEFCKQIANHIQKELPQCNKLVLFVAEKDAVSALLSGRKKQIQETCTALGIELRYIKI